MRAAPALLALFALLMLLPPGVSAQYMYLDSNGDGVNTADDRVSGIGTTHVTVWLDIAHDRDGNPVSCNTHTGAPNDGKVLDLFEYSVTLVSNNGTVDWGSFSDSLGFIPEYDFSTDSSFFFGRRIFSAGNPPGRYKLGSFDLTVASGSPAIQVSTGAPFPNFDPSYTLFGSSCPATDNPNSYTLGIDWFDADGLGAQAVAPLAARVFTTNSEDTFRIRSGKPTLCVQIEPVDADYENATVDRTTLTMRSPGIGTVDRILAISDKGSITEDRDRNGVPEITACFARTDLENLFDQVHGRKDELVTLEGSLSSGGTFRGTATLTIVGDRTPHQVSVSPNPLNPEAVLRFETDRPGPLRVRVFDVSGRMIRELRNEPSAPAGEHVIRIDGRAQRGEPLSSGIYLYRIETAERTVTGRFVILK